jgi:uncharacterized protein YciI
MFVLIYDLVDGYIAKREPFRSAHLDLAREMYEAGALRLAGALTDPVDQAYLVFNDRRSAEQFVRRDPYIANGLVSSHRIREWNVVVGG